MRCETEDSAVQQIGVMSIKALNYTYEVMDAIEEYYGDNPRLQVEIFHELYKSTHDVRYMNKYEKLCAENLLCPNCLSELTSNSHTERHGENYTYDETMTEYVCDYCDINEEN